MQLFSNNASTTLSLGLSDVGVTITVATGDGALFQSPTGSDYELATIGPSTSNEIVKITNVTGDVLTVVRAQESTVAQTWPAGSSISGMVTKGTLDRLLQNAATGTNAIASGVGSTGTGNSATALGYNASADNTAATAIGNGAIADAVQATSVGDNATAVAYAVAVGSNANSGGQGSVAIGYSASAQGASAVASGDNAYANSPASVAIGNLTMSGASSAWTALTLLKYGEVAIKTGTTHTFYVSDNSGTTGSTEPTWDIAAVGNTTTDGTVTWVYLGDINVLGYGTSAGWCCSSPGACNLAMGAASIAYGTQGVATGFRSLAASYSVAIGPRARTTDSDSIAIGDTAVCSGGTGAWGNMAAGAYAETYGNSHTTALGCEAINRIENTHVISGLSLIRKDNAESAANAGIYFTGSQAVVFSKEIDLTATAADDVATITIPTGSTFYPDEIGLVVTAADTVSGQPNVSFGITGNTVALLASTATTKTAVKGRDIFTLLSNDGVNSLTASVKTAATATTLKGRFYWVGVLVEDE